MNTETSRQAHWNPKSAQNALEAFLLSNNYNINSYSLVHFGAHAIYRDPSTTFCLKVFGGGTTIESVSSLYTLAKNLQSTGCPCIAPAFEIIPTPVEIGKCIITSWHWVESNPAKSISYLKFGKLLKDFHVSASNYLGKVSDYSPLERIDNSFKELQIDDPEEVRLLEALQSVVQEHAARYQDLEASLPKVLLHGDAHIGNVIPSDPPLFADLDTLSSGAEQWDLVPILVALHRFGLAQSDYKDFCSGYGTDLRDTNGHESIVVLREVMQTLWIYRNKDLSTAHKHEAIKRVKSIVTPEGQLWESF
jgi:hypothetical protein